MEPYDPSKDWMHISETPGNMCPHMQQGGRLDCMFNSISGPSVCNVQATAQWHDCLGGDDRRCGARFYRMCGLRDLLPDLWDKDCCCHEWRMLMLHCAEDTGYVAGGIDIRMYPNDGKDVWRNYMRVRLSFCPFCGADLRPLVERLLARANMAPALPVAGR